MKKRCYIVGVDGWDSVLYDKSELMFHELMYCMEYYNLECSCMTIQEIAPCCESDIRLYDDDVVNRSIFSAPDAIPAIAI